MGHSDLEGKARHVPQSGWQTGGSIPVLHKLVCSEGHALPDWIQTSRDLSGKRGDFSWHEHLTRASLLWRINGVTHADPSEALLRTAGESDCAILASACSKTDSYGVIWGDKPIYLSIRFGADYCAALSLMQLETRFPLHGKARARQPLFQMEAGKPFTFYCLFRVLDDLKDNFLPGDVNHKLFTYHSCRIYLATRLGSDKSITPEEIQAICRWQSAKSLGIYNRMQPRQYVALLDRANSAVITSYTTANLPCIDSYEEVAGPH